MNFVTTRWRVYFVSHEVLWIDMQQRYVKTSSYCISNFFMESRESCLAADGRAWKVDGRAQALVGTGLATPLITIGCIALLLKQPRKSESL